jgi:hypothetical protein
MAPTELLWRLRWLLPNPPGEAQNGATSFCNHGTRSAVTRCASRQRRIGSLHVLASRAASTAHGAQAPQPLLNEMSCPSAEPPLPTVTLSVQHIRRLVLPHRAARLPRRVFPGQSSAAQILYVPCNPLLPSSKHPSLHSKRRGATLHTNEWLRQRVYATPRWDEGGRTRCLHQPTLEGRSN